MAASPLGALVRFEGKDAVADRPSRSSETSASKTVLKNRVSEEDIEPLKSVSLEGEGHSKGATGFVDTVATNWGPPHEWDSTPTFTELDELETSRRSTRQRASGVVQSWNNPPANRWRVLAACLMIFSNGFNDSAPGAILPSIEAHYHIDYATVATIFITNAVGFLTAALFVHALDSKLGRARCVMLCEAINVVGYAVMVVAPPFPVLAIGYFVTGFGIATGLALNNVFVSNLANSTIMLGIMHGSYGIGGTIAPLIATAMVSHGILFSRIFAIMLGFRIVNFVMAAYALRNFEHDQGSTSPSTTELHDLGQLAEADAASGSSSAEREASTSKVQEFFQAFKSRTTLVGALFIFAYQGAEVSISGWIISFLIQVRHGDPSKVGNVTAGFWAGITVGRFLLSFVGHKFGEKLLVYILTALTLALQLVVWFTPNIIGDAVSIAIMGLLLGPIYPCATSIFAKLLPIKTQNTSLAFISSAGSSGGAVAPFAVGLIAQAAGTYVLHPICISLYAVMVACWLGLPKVAKHSD